ncbi:DNA invertase Pin-like site-specific DNA recombinase [Catenulispora sp. GAS73]
MSSHRLANDRSVKGSGASAEPISEPSGVRFAFAGRVSTEDLQSPTESRGWQLERASGLVAGHGEIVAEFFDVGQSRATSWLRRPQSCRLLEALADPERGFDAVVIGEPQRVFYDNQYGMVAPLFAHYRVPLWVPELGGPVDPNNEAHELTMAVFAQLAKAERKRIQVRVRTAMGAKARNEGRFLGGRPPYGYLLADAGPHPNPELHRMGVRLHQLAVDPSAGQVVTQIFTRRAAGHSAAAICRELDAGGCGLPVSARSGPQSAPDRLPLDGRCSAGDPAQSALPRLPSMGPGQEDRRARRPCERPTRHQAIAHRQPVRRLDLVRRLRPAGTRGS